MVLHNVTTVNNRVQINHIKTIDTLTTDKPSASVLKNKALYYNL